MKWRQRLAALLDPATPGPPKSFSLGDRGQQPHAERRQTGRTLAEIQSEAGALSRRIDRFLAARKRAARQGPDPFKGVGDLAADLDQNLDRLRTLFRAPDNADLIIRRVQVGTHPPLRAAVVFMEGMADRRTINDAILTPLMLLTHLDHHLEDPRGESGEPDRSRGALDLVTARLLPGNQVETKPDMKSVTEGILYGDTAIFIAGCRKAILVETKGFPLRSVDEPKTELAVRGPHDAFNESIRTNIALVRKRIKDPRLVTEMLTAGERTRTFVAVTYLDNVANPKLVAEVKRRVSNLRVDFVGEAGMLEQLVEDQPSSPFPQTLSTERPDRVAGSLSEGAVAVFVDNSPSALVVPVTFWATLQTAEDYHLRWPSGTFLRYIRLASLLITLLAGAIYVAAVNYHHEMLPTELILSVAANREVVPFPSALEYVAMEFAFELVREAGTRIPSVIGPTIGIVGALILGQAAVAARLFSPIVVIIVAMSGLASAAVPNYSMAFAIRLLRFGFTLLSVVLGIYGLAVGLFLMVVHLAGLKSFGVPYLSPVAPRRTPVPDSIIRQPLFQMEMRPRHLRPMDHRRQDEVARGWDPLVPDHPPGRGGDPKDAK